MTNFYEIDISDYGQNLNDRLQGNKVGEEIIKTLEEKKYDGVIIDLRKVRTLTSAFTFELFITLKAYFGDDYLRKIRIKMDTKEDEGGLKSIVVRALSALR